LPRNAKLQFVYFDAGGGHRSAALALQSVIESQQYGWDVELMNLQEVLDELDIFRKITRIRLQDLYNLALAKGWTLGSPYLLRLMHGVIRMYHRPSVRLLERYWRNHPADMVVSLVPNFNRALYDSVRRGAPGVPFVTILTDLADYPPHFWMEKQDQYIICGTSRAFEQAENMGYRQDRIFLTSGMILRPQFYERINSDVFDIRERLGLDPELPTALVLFGGEGSNVMYSIARSLGDSSLNMQLILICGRNQKLKRRLENLTTRNKMLVEGFTKEIPFFMSVADFFIGKPGPGSISEALQIRLPVIVEKNAWTLPQERFNADWVREQNVGVVLESFRQIESAVSALLNGHRLSEMKARIATMQNRAVFEIPSILEHIMNRQEERAGTPAAVPANAPLRDGEYS
jgi:1,2-diacylglycerol 3-beta-galactosyltransferase